MGTAAEGSDNGYRSWLDTRMQMESPRKGVFLYLQTPIIMAKSKLPPPRVSFLNCLCDLDFAQYGNGRLAIRLVGAEGSKWEGEPVAVATVNISDYPLRDKYVLIKNWSENEGIKEALQDAGIIGPSIANVGTGHVHANLCELLINPEDYK